MNRELISVIDKIAEELGVESIGYKLDYPDSDSHGDISTNAALAWSKNLGLSPKDVAMSIVAKLDENKPDFLEKYEIAGPGFINFWWKRSSVSHKVVEMLSNNGIAHDNSGEGQEVLVEYTDPNTFKVFHIGHLMSNAIGESISRLIQYSGAKVKRICYPSDIGLHIAKSIWALQKHLDEMPDSSEPIQKRTSFLGKMYVEGTEAYEKDEAVRDDIDALNKVIYEKSSEAVNALYEKGRKWSLEHFEELYRLLGTHFDDTIYESEMADVGQKIVKENQAKGIFTESDGAVVFKGEDFGLHTRVFINSKGLPTYEAKDVGLNVTKFERNPNATRSIVVTASEQNDYFKVLLKVISLIDPKHGNKTLHIGHGMMRFVSGKMSSRTGKVVTAEALIDDIKALVEEKIADRDWTKEEKEEISGTIAVGAIKYSILRSAIGSDIIFDSASSISFEGDSGPYLQYAAVRANSLLEKATHVLDIRKGELPESVRKDLKIPDVSTNVEKLLLRFGEVVLKARQNNSPHAIATYLIELAGAYNQLYANQKIVDESEPYSPYYIVVTRAFRDVLEKGLWLLGIKIPQKM